MPVCMYVCMYACMYLGECSIWEIVKMLPDASHANSDILLTLKEVHLSHGPFLFWSILLSVLEA